MQLNTFQIKKEIYIVTRSCENQKIFSLKKKKNTRKTKTT